MELNEHSQFESLGPVLSEEIKGFLRETAKWANFLSILGFIGVGILVIFALFAGTIFLSLGAAVGSLGSIPEVAITVTYLLIAALYFFPALYLYNFAKNTKIALSTNDKTALTESFKNLKSHYKFTGILAIVFIAFIAFYIISIFGALFIAILA